MTAEPHRLETWEVPSRFVDVAEARLNGPPPGAPPRPDALRAQIALPPGYDGERRFPVLYLLHGHGDGFDYWPHPERGDLLALIRGWEAVVVLPEGGRGWFTNWWNGGRRAPAWERYHLDELIPTVERRLRLMPGRRHRAIAGLSMGGFGALYYASQRPGYFGAAASFSGAIAIRTPGWAEALAREGDPPEALFGDPVAQAFYWEGHDPTALVASLRHTRLWIGAGDGTEPGHAAMGPDPRAVELERGARAHADAFLAAAVEHGVEVTAALGPGVHAWPLWRRHLRELIAWDPFGVVEDEPASWTFATVAQRAEAWGWRLTLPAPPERVVRIAMDRGRLEVDGAEGGKLRPVR